MDKITLRQALKAHSQDVKRHDDANSFSKSFFIPESFIAFQGHFPEKAVLPAIVQILMAELTIAEATGKNIGLKEVVQAKFTTPIEPNSNINCTIIQRKEWEWDCTILADDVLAAKFRLQGEVL